MTKRLEGPSSAVRIRVMKRDRFACTYCGEPGTDVELEVDHIIAVAHGGSHHMSNLTTACRACNQKKGSGDAPQRSPVNGRGHPLKGLWFHTWSDGMIQYQGQVKDVDGDVVIAQLYEWFTGSAGAIRVFSKAMFYSDEVTLYGHHDDMNYEYKMYSIKRDNMGYES